MATLAGHTLGKYRIIGRMGRGGMADVYRAYHPRLDRYVAIKVLHGYLAEGEADFLARFEREARAVAALQHPHVVQVYDFDVEDDVYYMVMQLVDGGTLKAKLSDLAQAGERMPLPEVLQLFREVAGALHYAHEQGMLHRDVKPANVLLDEAGRAILSDFGIARIVGDSQFTTTGALIGTPAYMSPEQGMGERATVASDIYSLGVILYELVVGQAPFDADTPLAVIHKHIHEPLPSPRLLRAEVPEALERVVLKALAKEPGDRYQSAEEMLRAVEAALGGLPSEAPPVPPPAVETPPPAVETAARQTERAAPPTPTPAPPRAPEPTVATAPTVPPAPRRRWPLVLAVVAGVLLVGGLAYAATRLLPPKGATSCAPPSECEQQAHELLAANDPAGAVDFFDRALALAEAGEHPPFAHLWCERGETSVQLEWFDEAARDFEQCIDWTEGDPDLEPIRTLAEEQLQRLRASPASFTEPFDDPGLPGWEHNAAVVVSSGVARLEPGGFLARSGEWPNLTLAMWLRFLPADASENPVWFVVSYRASEAGANLVVIGDGFVAVSRESGDESQELVNSPAQSIPPGEWFELRVVVLDTEHVVLVNGEPVATAVDREPLPPGGVGLEAPGDAVIEIDELVMEGS